MSEKNVQSGVAVLLAGGGGTRLWPLSTLERPKQFQCFFGKRTLLQESFDRIRDLFTPENILVLTQARYLSLVKSQLAEIPEKNIVGEPMVKDTGAAIALATRMVEVQFGGNTSMCILPSDQWIEPKKVFQEILLSVLSRVANENVLYTLGISPDFPATQYGYLKVGKEVQKDGATTHFVLEHFHEKPDVQTAQKYLEDKNFYWNSGIFIWSVATIKKEIQNHLSHHWDILSTLTAKDFQNPAKLKHAFEQLEPISIDYGVLEKSKNLRMAHCSFSWNDLGSWSALEPFLEKDEMNNLHQGKITSVDAANNLVYDTNPEANFSLFGVDNLVVVHCGDHTLVTRRDLLPKMKGFLQKKAK